MGFATDYRPVGRKGTSVTILTRLQRSPTSSRPAHSFNTRHPFARMFSLRPLLLSLALLSYLAHASKQVLPNNRWLCQGMYAKGDIIGGRESSIEVEVTEMSDPSNTQLIILNWDENTSKEKMEPTCPEELLQAGTCTAQAYALTKFPYPVAGKETHVEFLKDKTVPYKYSYPVKTTGYYCVSPNLAKGGQISAVVDWRNPYGELDALEYPKLPFYGIVSVLYLCLGILWMIKCSFHWRDLLPIQHYISGVMFFVMVEMSFAWGYWADYNATGEKSKPLLALSVVLNSARLSLSFYMLLIVALGYGVVKPTLGSTMNKCLGLMYAHFFFGSLYAAGSMLTSIEASGLFILVFVLPLSITMTIFYTWTFQALKDTISTLEVRRQSVKTLMYRRLFRLLAFSVAFVCLFFVISAITFSQRVDVNSEARNWRYRWFLYDGWLNILYLIVFFSVCYLWRPTSNNQRYGLQEVATDEEGADAADLESGITTGTVGQNIKLRDVPRTRRSDDSSHRQHSEDGEDQGAIFDIGEAVDEWLDEKSQKDENEIEGDERLPEDRRALFSEQSKLN